MTVSEPAAPAGPAVETPWSALPPRALLVNLVPSTVAMVRQLWPLLLVMLLGGTAGGEGIADALLLGLFLLSSVGATVVHMLTLRYRLAEGRLEIQTGVLQRQVRVIAPNKVQNVELVRNVLHRLTGLVEVRIETASGVEVEGMLSGLLERDAEVLVQALSAARRAGAEVDEELPVLVHNDLTDLVWFGATTARFGAAVVVLGVAFEVLGAARPDRVARLGTGLGPVGLLAAFMTALIGAWLVGIAGAVVSHHGFRLERAGDRLVAQSGLFTRRRTELPLHKVQIVSLIEPWLRRRLGFGSLYVETAAARTEGGGTERSRTMVPVVPVAEQQRLVGEILPALDVDLVGGELRRAEPRVLRRALWRAGLQGALLSAIASWWAWPLGAVAWLSVPGLAALAWFDWSMTGWLLTERVVVARRGYLVRVTEVVARDKLQAVVLVQDPLLRAYGLAEVVLRVAGAEVVLPLLDEDEAFALSCRLSASAALPRPAPLTDALPALDGAAPP
jgi:putative membrane protein